METRARSRRRRLEEEEEEGGAVDHIGRLPDAVLGEIISLLPTKDGARTQAFSRRWRPLWRAAPLNLDGDHLPGCSVDDVARILAAHPGPGRRFSVHTGYLKRCASDRRAEILDGFLRSPALDNLQELEAHYHYGGAAVPPPPPVSVRRFASTLRLASFGSCSFPDHGGDDAGGALQLPLLKHLSLLNAVITEKSLYGLLAGCPGLQSLLLFENRGLSRVRIVSSSLRSSGVNLAGCDLELIVEDAPCLERCLCSTGPSRLELGATVFQGLRLVNLGVVVQSIKVLSLLQDNLSLDVVINFMKCFPCLENLYIKTHRVGEKNVWCHKYRDVIGSLDFRLKKIVLTNYRGNSSHVNFAKFFLLNARVLESMRLELESGNPNSEWIERQHRVLRIKNKASRGAQFEGVIPHLAVERTQSEPLSCFEIRASLSPPVQK
ncbi:hypothetical protein ACP4OV_028913 [Aristida adscensionis]